MKMPLTSWPVPAAIALASTLLYPSILGAKSFQYASGAAVCCCGGGGGLQLFDHGATAEDGAEKQALDGGSR